MNRFLVRMLALLLLSVSPVIFAESVIDLYETDVALAQTEDNAYQQALSRALEAALIKVSGNAAIATVGEVMNQLPQAEHYVSNDFYGKTDKGAVHQARLHVEFDPKAIDALLRDAGQPRWGADRPLIGVWVSLARTGQAPEILTNDHLKLWPHIQAHAAQRGLPIILPVSDLKSLDASILSAVTQEDAATLLKASKRYAVDGLLIGNLVLEAGGHWQARWLFVYGDQTVHWQDRDDSLEQALGQGVDDVADRLANLQSILPDSQAESSVPVFVQGLKSASDYAQFIKALSVLAPVQSVLPRALCGAGMQFSVLVTGGEVALLSAIQSTNGQLKALAAAGQAQGQVLTQLSWGGVTKTAHPHYQCQNAGVR